MDRWLAIYSRHLINKYQLPSDYKMIYDVLLEKEFYSDIEADNSRIEDAINLRSNFIEFLFDQNDTSLLHMFADADTAEETIEYLECEPITCFEVLLALAIKMRSDIWGDEHISDSFLMFLKNLDLDISNDAFYRVPLLNINERISSWLDKKYDYNGSNGNIFRISDETLSIKRKKIDIRKIPLWEQASLYYTDYIPF